MHGGDSLFYFFLCCVFQLRFCYVCEVLASVFGNGYGIGSGMYPIYDPWVCVHDGRSRIEIDNCIALGTDSPLRRNSIFRF